VSERKRPFSQIPASGATQKSCTNFLALKGRNIPAQGIALGKYKKEFLAL